MTNEIGGGATEGGKVRPLKTESAPQLKYEWSVPALVDFKEWRKSVIGNIHDLAREALTELIEYPNFKRMWQDRSIYIFIRDVGTTLATATFRVEYLGTGKFGVIKI